jgi:hypothetical protein
MAALLGAAALMAIPSHTVARDSSDGVAEAQRDRDRDGLTDRFERRWGATAWRQRDSDRDGVRDAAEDHDGDGLGNLGEQRFRTSPVRSDSDGDGVPDGQEDSDRDDASNAAEQDSRPVPARLRPSLASAIRDKPISYYDECHTDPYVARIRPCVYGRKRARVTIALYGDSHAAQWLPALIREGQRRAWRVVSITKSGCPSIRVRVHVALFPGAASSCSQWRRRADAWLRASKPDLIVVSNYRAYKLLDSNGEVLQGGRRLARWQAGLRDTLRAFDPMTEVVVLGDTPRLDRSPPSCLRDHRRRISACATWRAEATNPRHDQAEASVARRVGATFVSLNRQVCSYDPCPLIVNELLIWRDDHHLTATYARQLAPSLGNRIARLMRQPGQARRSSAIGPTRRPTVATSSAS